MQSKQLKSKYKRDYENVRKLINEFDPCGLIDVGAPEDEYDCLTDKLLISLRDNKTDEEIRSLILHEIEHHFGTPDLKTIEEPFKTRFYRNLDGFLNQVRTFANKM